MTTEHATDRALLSRRTGRPLVLSLLGGRVWFGLVYREDVSS